MVAAEVTAKNKWRGVGVAYRAGFENQCARQSTGGSNPPLSVFSTQ